MTVLDQVCECVCIPMSVCVCAAFIFWSQPAELVHHFQKMADINMTRWVSFLTAGLTEQILFFTEEMAKGW